MSLTHLTTRLRRKKAAQVARASGVHVNTVERIKRGQNTNPQTKTIEKLNAALDSMEGREND